MMDNAADENWSNSLKKAALLLGVNEINKFDYKSINSIRKLAKTFGCDEYELIKTFDSSQLNLPDEKQSLEDRIKSELIKNKSSTYDLRQSNNNNNNKISNIKNITNLAAKNHVNKFKSKSSKYFGSSKSTENANDACSGGADAAGGPGTAEKSFKRIISNNKKLPSKFTFKEDEKKIAEQMNKLDELITTNVEKTSQKREVILYRDENLGFGFIAGSEKPLKIRFVTPDGPGKNKLLNGDEILAVNDEDVEFASREHVISLIRKSNNKIKLVVKQPTPKSNNSLLLTEDKKAIKKSTQLKNKVRFQLDNDSHSQQQQQLQQSTIQTNDEDRKGLATNELVHPDTSPTINGSNCHNMKLTGQNERKVRNYENTNAQSPLNNRSVIKFNSATGEQHIYTNANASYSSIFKVYLENKHVKSFKYDRNTQVKDVLCCLKDKLAINNIEYFGLVLKPLNDNSISKFKLLNEIQLLHEVHELYLSNDETDNDNQDENDSDDESSQGDFDPNGNNDQDDDNTPDEDQSNEQRKKARKYSKANEPTFVCLFRFVFIPSDFHSLKLNDPNAFNYLYKQSVSDVMHDRFGNELQYEMILHLSTLNLLYEYLISNTHLYSTIQATSNMSSSYTTISNSLDSSINQSAEDMHDVNLKFFEEEFKLENFLPKMVLESNILKKKDLKKLLFQNLNWFFEKKFFNITNIQIEYLKCMNELLQFSGRIYFVNLLEQSKETFIIVGSNYGVATFIDLKSKTLLNLAKFDTIENIRVSYYSPSLIRIDLDVFEIKCDNEIINKTLTFGFLKDEYLEFLYLIQGYLRMSIYDVKNRICPIQVIKSPESQSLNIPVFLVKHPNRKTTRKLLNTKEKSVYCFASEKADHQEPVEDNETLEETQTTCASDYSSVVEKLPTSSKSINIPAATAPAAPPASVPPSTAEPNLLNDKLQQYLDEKKNQLILKSSSSAGSSSSNSSSPCTTTTTSCCNEDDERKPAAECKAKTAIYVNVRRPGDDEENYSSGDDNDDDDEEDDDGDDFERDVEYEFEPNDEDQDHEDEMENLNEEHYIRMDETHGQNYFNYSKINLKIIDSNQIHNESLPLIESFQLLNQNELSEIKSHENNESTTNVLSDNNSSKLALGNGSFFINKRFELKEFKIVNNSNVSHLNECTSTHGNNSTVMVANKATGTGLSEESEEELKSISSIEGSLKAGLCNDRVLCGNSSSTPLICLYQSTKETNMEIGNHATERRQIVYTEFVDLNNHHHLNTKNNNNSNNHNQSVRNYHYQKDNTLEANYDQHQQHQLNANLDFIDLSKVENQQILDSLSVPPPPPPPLQFSDHFQLNEFKRNDFEIESGIESDSSNDIQQTNTKVSDNEEYDYKQDPLKIKNNQQDQTPPSRFISNLTLKLEKFDSTVEAPLTQVSSSQKLDSPSIDENPIVNTESSPPADSLVSNLKPSEVKAREKQLLRETVNGEEKPLQTGTILAAAASASAPQSVCKIIHQPTVETQSANLSSGSLVALNPPNNSQTSSLNTSTTQQQSTSSPSCSSLQHEYVNNCPPGSFINKVMTLAKSYEPVNSNNSRNTTTPRIIKIIDNKIIDFSKPSFRSYLQTHQSQSRFSPINDTKSSQTSNNDSVKEAEVVAKPEENQTQLRVEIHDYELVDEKYAKTVKDPAKSDNDEDANKSGKKKKYVKSKTTSILQPLPSPLLITPTSNDSKKIVSNTTEENHLIKCSNSPSGKKEPNSKFVSEIRSFFDKLNLSSSSSSSSSYRSKSDGGGAGAKKADKVDVSTATGTGKKALNLANLFVNLTMSNGDLKKESNKSTRNESESSSSSSASSNMSDFRSKLDKIKYFSFPPSKSSTKAATDKFNTCPRNGSKGLLASLDVNCAVTASVNDRDKENLVKALISPNNFSSAQVGVKKELKNHSSSMFSSTELIAENFMSPKKGALKKNGIKDKEQPSFGRSTLKVRWKDMIEITNLVDDSDEHIYNGTEPTSVDDVKEHQQKEPKELKPNTKKSETNNDVDDTNEINDLYDDTESSDESDEYDEIEGTYHKIEKTRFNVQEIDKKSAAADSSSTSSASTSSSESNEKKVTVCKCEHLLLKPLHSTGKEFKKEMNERIEKLNKIKLKTNFYANNNNEKIFDEIQHDLDCVLLELHSTIEHIRISSMLVNSASVDGDSDEEDAVRLSEKLKMFSANKQQIVSEFTHVCDEFVSKSKIMVNSALAHDDEVIKLHLKNSMILVCSLVVHCFDTIYAYLYKNEKLDEIRQLLIQILNLLNTFRSSLNVTYLFSTKKLDDKNANLLFKQSNNIENDICFLIEYFRILF